MKTIEEIIKNYKEYETFIDDRFGRRFCEFLTIKQMGELGFGYSSKEAESKHIPKEWNEENVLIQMKEDVEFGWLKACNERGISASLMYNVVKSWCKVLDNKLANFDRYEPYGKPLFLAVAELYGWELY